MENKPGKVIVYTVLRGVESDNGVGVDEARAVIELPFLGSFEFKNGSRYKKGTSRNCKSKTSFGRNNV